MGDYYAQSKNQHNQNYPQQQNQPFYPQQQNQPYYPQQQNQPYYPQQQNPYQQQPAYSPPNYANNNTASNAALNSGGNGAGFHPEKFNKKSKYNDVWAAVLFWVHLLGFAVLAYFAITTYRNPPAHLSSTSSSQVKPQVSAVVGISLALSTLAGFILSLIYFILMEKFASTVIKATFIASIIFFFAYAAYLFYIGALIAAIIGLVFAVIYLACWFWWRSRIPFASVMLETVTGVTKKYKGTFGATIVGAIVQLAYSIFFFFTIIGVIYMTTDDPNDCKTTVNNKGQSIQSCPSDGKRAALILFSIFSFYWVSQVIKTTVHVTVSGVFAAYYFLEGSTEGVPSSPTIGSAKRALTTSFGSICFGSLIIAVIRTVRTLLRNARDNSEGGFAYFIAACAECLLNWIESLVEYFNHYAYTQVAIYGKDYCTAAKDTWRMIKDRGVEAIINDNLIGNVLSMGAILIGGLTSLIVLLYLKINGASPTEESIICILAFVIGFVMMCLVGEVIESGTATTFVALAEDPQALARTKPFLFEKIRQTYPQIVMGV